MKTLTVGVIGPAVGKTPLILRFLHPEIFVDEYDPTCIDSYRADLDGFRLEITDVGCRYYSTFSSQVYCDCRSFLFCFSAKNRDTLDEAKECYDNLIQHQVENVVPPIVLVACCCDGDDINDSLVEEARQWAADREIPYVCTSAKDGVNCRQPFAELLVAYSNYRQKYATTLNRVSVIPRDGERRSLSQTDVGCVVGCLLATDVEVEIQGGECGGFTGSPLNFCPELCLRNLKTLSLQSLCNGGFLDGRFFPNLGKLRIELSQISFSGMFLHLKEMSIVGSPPDYPFDFSRISPGMFPALESIDLQFTPCDYCAALLGSFLPSLALRSLEFVGPKDLPSPPSLEWIQELLKAKQLQASNLNLDIAGGVEFECGGNFPEVHSVALSLPLGSRTMRRPSETHLGNFVQQFPNLTIFEASACVLSVDERFFDSMRLLTELDLSYNALETIPESLSLLTNLKKLDISGNYLSSLPSLSMMSRLAEFRWGQDALTKFPADLPCSLENLTGGSKGIRVIPDLSHLTRLTELELRCKRVSDWRPLEPLLPQLVHLSLQGTKAKDLPLEKWPVAPKLQSLTLKGSYGEDIPSAFLRGRLPRVLHCDPISYEDKEVLEGNLAKRAVARRAAVALILLDTSVLSRDLRLLVGKYLAHDW